ncbi:MAG: serine/threonine protein kinase [Planctomycetes bacterium]|nr:serine/threonine protein kinase [Planctomycetota bacterium]
MPSPPLPRPSPADAQPPSGSAARPPGSDSLARQATEAYARPKQRFGRYEVVRCLGQGGMGTVYEADDPQLGRKVAIKVVQESQLGDPHNLERFLREARATAALDDPHVVKIHDIGGEGGRPFLAMEFVPGRSLQEALDRVGRLPAATALRYTLHAARGLRAAWAHGIVHRDVKPGNLLLADSGLVKVTDFGLARRTGAEQDGGLTRTGEVVGTPLYLAPEQAQAAPADFRADIYSLGATLYHMLAGCPPFSGSSALGIVADHIHKAPAPLAVRAPRVPRRTAQVVERMLAKEPGRRHASYDELIADLEAAQADLGRTRLPLPLWAAVAAGLGGGLLLWGVYALWGGETPSPDTGNTGAGGSGPTAPAGGAAPTGTGSESAGGGAPAAPTPHTPPTAPPAPTPTVTDGRPTPLPAGGDPAAPLTAPDPVVPPASASGKDPTTTRSDLRSRFHGACADQGDECVELAYDFSSPDQALDFGVAPPPGSPPGAAAAPSGKLGWLVEGGRLISTGRAPTNHLAEFVGDLIVEVTLTLTAGPSAEASFCLHQGRGAGGYQVQVGRQRTQIARLLEARGGMAQVIPLSENRVADVAPGVPHRVRIERRAERIQLWIDGKLDLTAESSESDVGAFGLFARAPGVVLDDLHISGRLTRDWLQGKR